MANPPATRASHIGSENLHPSEPDTEVVPRSSHKPEDNDLPAASSADETDMHIIEHVEFFDEINGQYQYTGSSVVYESNGQIYRARSEVRLSDQAIIYMSDFTDKTLIPIEAYAPLYVPTLTKLDSVLSGCYLKRPRFGSYDSNAPHRILDDVLAEAETCERLRQNPHRNLGQYLGCQVQDGRIMGLCFTRYAQTLMDRVNPRHYMKRAVGGSGWAPEDIDRLLRDVKSGLGHLHALGLVHNDVNPANIMFDDDGNPVIIDFGSCLPIGASLEAGGRTYEWYDEAVRTSMPKNDFDAVAEIGEWLSDKPFKNFRFKE